MHTNYDIATCNIAFDDTGLVTILLIIAAGRVRRRSFDILESRSRSFWVTSNIDPTL